MSETKEPPESYITQQNGVFYHVTEYGDDDLEIQVQYESAADKLGYLVVYHVVTLDRRLSHGAFRLYCLYHYWAQQSGRAWPSLKTIADHLGVSRASVVAYNKELEECDYISRYGRKADHGGQLTSMVLIRSISNNAGASEIAAKIFTGERDLRFEGGGGQQAEQVVSQLDGGGQPVSHEELTIEEVTNEEKKRLSKRAKSPPEPDGNYLLEFHYRDKEHVSAIGTVTHGPWSVECPDCGDGIVIHDLETETECLCGMHTVLLYKKKRGTKYERLPDAVDAYYQVVRSRGIKYGSNETWHTEIVATVTDVQFWTLVVKEWIAQGWNPLSTDRMLVYYREGRVPGSRKATKQKPTQKATAEQIEQAKAETPILFMDAEEVERRLRAKEGRPFHGS